ncbi:MAG TPA: MFS transporter, partial [Kiloniellaceae bacterium]|nr:MFS transporter [Kiloniellaceae bacterium]
MQSPSVTRADESLRAGLVVGLSFLALALTYSARAAFGLVMPLLEQELSWSRSFTSATAATALITMAVLAPLAGRLVDRQGARAV